MSARLTIHDTGRRYYASAREAFAEAERKTIEYACAIERHRADRAHVWVTVACITFAAIVGLMAWAGMLPGN